MLRSTGWIRDMSKAFNHKSQFKEQEISFDIQKLNWFRDLKFNLNEIKETSHNHILTICIIIHIVIMYACYVAGCQVELMGPILPQSSGSSWGDSNTKRGMGRLQVLSNGGRGGKVRAECSQSCRISTEKLTPQEAFCICADVIEYQSQQAYESLHFQRLFILWKFHTCIPLYLKQFYNPAPLLPRTLVITSFQPHALFL